MGNNCNNSKTGANEVIRDFDDILVHINGWGFYQWMLLVYTCGIAALLSYAQNASVLILYEPPDFRCAQVRGRNGLNVEMDAVTLPCDFEDDMAKKCCMPKTQVREVTDSNKFIISYLLCI